MLLGCRCAYNIHAIFANQLYLYSKVCEQMCLHAVMEAITEGQTTDANIYGPQTTQGCWGSARGSYIHRWQPKYYAHTFAQLAAKEMKQAINTRSTTGRDLFPLPWGELMHPRMRRRSWSSWGRNQRRGHCGGLRGGKVQEPLPSRRRKHQCRSAKSTMASGHLPRIH